MYRTAIAFLLTGLLAVAAGCGGDGNDSAPDSETEAPRTISEAPEGESRSMIPEPLEAVEGVTLVPYFDEAGTVSEMAVSPGETVTIYVTAEYGEPYHINAAQFRVDLPDGLEMVSEAKFTDRVVTVGSWESDFSMAFECRPPGKFYLVKYTCTAGSGFSGGEVRVTPGVSSKGSTYLGFVSCEPKTEKLPASGGSATLALK